MEATIKMKLAENLTEGIENFKASLKGAILNFS